jgi:streptomycin 6-kinase
VVIEIPSVLQRNVSGSSDGAAWLARLPELVSDLTYRWRLSVGSPVNEEVSGSWVAPCLRADGTAAILKLGFPHMEALHEIDGLAFWSGNPTVRLLESDHDRNALLLERCIPGNTLRSCPEDEQDVVISGLLPRLWRAPAAGHPFRSLAQMIEYWCDGSRRQSPRWPDKELAERGIRVFRELLQGPTHNTLLATDLHAGNVLSAEREAWLVIDPKPFVGDPCFDATQHLLNCWGRMHTEPMATTSRFARLLGVDEQRVRHWTFARLVVEIREEMTEPYALARLLSV